MTILQWFRDKFSSGDNSPLVDEFDRYEVGETYIHEMQNDSDETTCSVSINYIPGNRSIFLNDLSIHEDAIEVRGIKPTNTRALAKKICKFLNDDIAARERYFRLNVIKQSTMSDSML